MNFTTFSCFRFAFLALFALSLPGISLAADHHENDFRVLVFSKTAGFRHKSIEAGVAAVKKLGKERGFDVEATEDSAVFEPANLGRFQAVVFLNTTGTIFDEAQREAFQAYVRGGGGFVGIHSAADTEYDWEWYGKLVGAYFKSHPRIQEAVIRVEDRNHPATRHLPPKWTRTDEWYSYRANPRGEEVFVLMSLDTKSFEGSQMGDDHPISWFQEFEGGRAFYTGLGHTEESFVEEAFLEHMMGAIRWAAGVAETEKAAGQKGGR